MRTSDKKSWKEKEDERMSTRVCEYCFDYFATSSEIVAHYQTAHKEEEGE